MYRFYDLNISIMMLGITLSIHNNEYCYIYVLRRSIFRQVYYYPAMLTVFKNNAFVSHTIHAMKQFNHDAYERPNGSKPIAWGLIGLYISRSYHFIGASIPFHMPCIVSQYHDLNEKYGQENGGGVRQKFAKISQCQTGHQWTKLLMTVHQIVQFCIHVLWIEQSFNMLVSKDGAVIQCG